MEKTYNPQAIETQWYQTWEQAGYFSPEGTGSPYCIMLPPPNVTGSLHMGHAFQHTLMDILIRYHRMSGDKTLWQCGTDHAGIATQMVVERQLEQENTDRHELGREKFTESVWDWKAESGSTITRQLRRLGTSMDWSRERFTLDEGLSDVVREVFIQLYKEGLIYRGKRLVNWDPVLHTAISDLEVISEEEDGHMWHIRYPISDEYAAQGSANVARGRTPGATPLADSEEYLIVATTRPETMLGDAAVAVHPDDDRYKDLIGKEVELPLTGRKIPIIADDYVDPEFGTGCVKITPAHDFNDYEMGQRHDLPLINIFTVDAVINNDAPEAYRGMDRYVARKQIVVDLEVAGLLEKIEPHRLVVPRGDRSHTVIEPYLTDQWYVKIQPLADPAIKAVESGDIKFVPENWSKTYFEWMRNIQDWCISRQLWWGHRIPAWYDEAGNIYVGHSELDVRKDNNLSDETSLKQDPDVLDTWFSSALWPFSTLGWPDQTQDMEDFYPTNVLVTGFDIIFFWVARMIMMGLKFTGKVPFKEIYIHGLIRDAEGHKMSKSKGNVLDPIDLIDGIDLEALIQKRTTGLMKPRDAPKIEKATRKHFPEGIENYGTDALRFTFASLATQGRDISFDVGRIGGYRNFCNKLWNASRYVIMNVEGQTLDINNGEIKFSLAERWINTRMAQTIDQVTKGIHTYRFDLAAQSLYEFTWDEYCDWYLELSKTTLTDPNASAAEKRGTLQTLINNLEILLRLMHPFMPFITEELWQKIAPILGKEGNTIMLQTYPGADELVTDEASLKEIEWVKEFILGVRKIRAERDIDPRKSLAVKIKGGTEQEQACLNQNSHYLKDIGRIESITTIDEEPVDAVIALAGNMTLLVPLADLIDPQAELVRLQKEIDKLKDEKERIEKKLGDEKFTTRAPEQVVNKERERLSVIITTSGTLEEQHKRISYVTERK
ncbi:MAG: valine--tRNA ligase [Proteobacteria bacterium]|nr:valine--tRNA ligase [Pseudomonadota bacterium]